MGGIVLSLFLNQLPKFIKLFLSVTRISVSFWMAFTLAKKVQFQKNSLRKQETQNIFLLACMKDVFICMLTLRSVVLIDTLSNRMEVPLSKFIKMYWVKKKKNK